MFTLNGFWLAASLLQTLQVTLRHRRHVSTAENTNLEALISTRTEFGTCSFEIFSSQEDDVIRVYRCCDSFAITFVRNQFCRGG